MFDERDREVSLSVLRPSVDAVSKPAHVSWPGLLVERKNTSTGLAWAKLTGVTFTPQAEPEDCELAHVDGERVVV